MTNVILRWAGPSGAASGDTYRIETNETAPTTYAEKTTVSATTPYESPVTTLDGAIEAGATSLAVASATNFADDDYAFIGRELFLLGGKSTNTFGEVTGGQGGTTEEPHATGVTVTKAHESYTAAITFGSRHLIRCRVIRIQSGAESIAAEAIAVNPTLPGTNNLTTLWGVLDYFGAPKSGITVKLEILDADNYHAGTSEGIYRAPLEVTTDTDGYFEFVGVPRDVDRVGGDQFRLTVDPGGVGERIFDLTQIPDKNTVNIWECI